MLFSAHRIRSQRWRVTARSQAQAFALRHQLREGLHQTLLPVFERAFDELAAKDEVLHLSRLELHVRVRESDRWMEGLAERLYQNIHERLGSLVRGEPEASRTATVLQRSPVGSSRLERLFRYLRSGLLPWPLAGAPGGAILEELRLSVPRDLPALVNASPPRQARRTPSTSACSNSCQRATGRRWPGPPRQSFPRAPPTGWCRRSPRLPATPSPGATCDYGSRRRSWSLPDPSPVATGRPMWSKPC